VLFVGTDCERVNEVTIPLSGNGADGAAIDSLDLSLSILGQRHQQHVVRAIKFMLTKAWLSTPSNKHCEWLLRE
jgi:hypothetical protein